MPSPFCPNLLSLSEKCHQFVSCITKPFDLISYQVRAVGPVDFVAEDSQPYDAQDDPIACLKVANRLPPKGLIEPFLDKGQFFFKKTLAHLNHLLSFICDKWRDN
jgi:hypothetical protein